MRILPMIFGVLSISAFGAGYVDPVFYVDNPGGSISNAFEDCTFTKSVGGVESPSSYGEFAAATTGTLVKRGTGWVSITEDNAGFAGDVHVISGVLHNRAVRGLGAAASGGVYVNAGATLYQDVTINEKIAKDYARKLYLAGEGVSGLGGALYVRHLAPENDINWMFMGGIVLTADTIIVLDSTKRPNCASWHTIDLAGHKLRVMSCESRDKVQIQLNGTVSNSAPTATTMYADDLQLDLASVDLPNAAGVINELVLTNKTRVMFRPAAGTRSWRLKVDDPERMNLYGTGTGIGAESMTNLTINDYNKWHGPVVLNSDLRIRKWDESSTAKYYSLTFLGPVSGKGGILTDGDLANQRNLVVGLCNADNSFEGGVSLYMGSLNLYATTALPADGGPAVITNGVLGLGAAGDYALPDCRFEGDCKIVGVVQASGQAKSVTKTGDGTLHNETQLGMRKLDVQRGTYRQSAPTWAAVAGVREYCRQYATVAETRAAFAAADPQVDFTAGRLSMPATHMQDPVWGANANNKLFVYRGYIWNRESTDVTWALATLADDGGSLRIDGVEVARGSKYNANTTSFVITPGPHAFEYRIYNETGYKGALDYDLIRTFDGKDWTYQDKVAGPKGADGKPDYSLGSWKGDLYSIMYKTGAVTYFDTDYRQFQDPGDGSLLTTSTNLTELAAQYGEMKFAAGTTLDLGNWATTTSDLVGMPSVVNGDFAVTGSWTFAAADVGVRRLSLEGKLEFGESAVAKVDGDISGLDLPIVVAEAAGGVSMPRKVEVISGAGKYVLRQTSATEVSLESRPGVILIVK